MKCVRRMQAGNRMQVESKKTFLREGYRRVQAGVGCRLSVKTFSTWNVHVGISMKSSYKMYKFFTMEGLRRN